MEGLATRSEATINGSIVANSNWQPESLRLKAPSQSSSPDLVLQFGVPEFELQFGGSLIDIDTTADYSVVTIKSVVDSNVSALVTLRNDPARNILLPLKTNELSVNILVDEHSPRACFFSESLYAVFGLAGKVNVTIPQLGLNLGANFQIPPSQISKMMQLRQIYFGLVTIERATRMTFRVPSFIPGEDIDAISFSYHAIVARNFRWLCNDVTLMMPATEENLDWLQTLSPTVQGGSIYRVNFGPTPKSRTIFGQVVSLGDETLYLDDAVIQDRDAVMRSLRRKDGHVVPVKFRPLSRKGRYVFDNSPRLPNSPWDSSITALIGLENYLDANLTAKYNELAASELTPDEIADVLASPLLDEDSHLIKE